LIEFVSEIILASIHGENEKILLRDLKFCWTDLKIILLNHQNNFVGILINVTKNFNILAEFYITSSTFINYFDGSTKLLF